MIRSLTLLLLVVASICHLGESFTHPTLKQGLSTMQSTTSLNVFGKKKEKEDLSFIESRDMTREEMLALNAENEEVMNMELQMMTGFSLVISLPILYLCWVAFFSD
mmetsp:Transcript_273/g.369  ORF Transcript_273/g.369 Transcript_273/m.369 type:complete len:106 (-) Transcript_273:70-387(-)